jgi:cysteinyl-tRNA synthetase
MASEHETAEDYLNIWIDGAVAARDEARKQKDFARADEIKAELLAIREGFYRVALNDEEGGTRWHWTTTR